MIAMADDGVINLGHATVVEKGGRGHPRGSKNKPKNSAVSSSAIPAKRHHGRSLGSKNKKTFAATASAAKHLV
jgi:hypothetical protein